METSARRAAPAAPAPLIPRGANIGNLPATALVVLGACITLLPLGSLALAYATTGTIYSRPDLPAEQQRFELLAILIPDVAIAFGGIGIMASGWAMRALTGMLTSLHSISASVERTITVAEEDMSAAAEAGRATSLDSANELERLSRAFEGLKREVDAHARACPGRRQGGP